MKEKLSHQTRKEVFEEAGIVQKKRNGRYNIHHDIFKSDVKRGLVPRNFPINERRNLTPLPIDVHNDLHELVERTPAFRNNIECRKWLANMAYNGELDLI
jgi:hypothetical protein